MPVPSTRLIVTALAAITLLLIGAPVRAADYDLVIRTGVS